MKRLKPYTELLIDNHYSEFAADTLSKVDIRCVVKEAKGIGIDCLMLQTKGHWGNSYYNTVIGHRHESLSYDLVRRFLDEGERQKLPISLYYSVRLDEYHVRKHRLWKSLDINGKPLKGAQWTFLCLNSPYGEHSLRQIKEIVELFQFERLFLDIVDYGVGNYNWSGGPCYCKYCKNLWLKKYGYEMPVIDEKEVGKYYEFKIDILKGYFKRIKDIIVKSGKPIRFTHNANPPHEYDDYVVQEADSFSPNQIATPLLANISRDKKKMFQISIRFDKPLGSCFGGESEEQLAYEMATSFSHRAEGIVLWGAPDIKDNWYGVHTLQKIKNVLKNTSPLREALKEDMEPYGEIGVLFSLKDRTILEPSLKRRPNHQINDETLGMYRYLLKTHLPFKLIWEEKLDIKDLKQVRLLMIGNMEDASLETKKILNNYVKKGGLIILSGDSFFSKKIPGLKIGNWESREGFVLKTKLRDHTDRCIPIKKYRSILHKPDMAKAIYYLVESAVGESNSTSNSHTARPERPGRATNRPLVILGQYGKGKYIYFSYEIFSEYLQVGKLYNCVFKEVFNLIGYNAEIKVNAPTNLETTFYRTGYGYKLFLVNSNIEKTAPGNFENSSLINFEKPIPIFDAGIEISFPVDKVLNLKGESLSVTKRGRKYMIEPVVINEFDVIDIYVSK